MEHAALTILVLQVLALIVQLHYLVQARDKSNQAINLLNETMQWVTDFRGQVYNNGIRSTFHVNEPVDTSASAAQQGLADKG